MPCSMIFVTEFSTVSASATGVVRRDANGCGGDLRILGDGQRGDRQGACEHHDNGKDPGKDWAIDKKARHVLILAGRGEGNAG